MNILFNFSTLKIGGGQNVALNFLNDLIKRNSIKPTYYFLVVKDSTIHQLLLDNNVENIFTTYSSPIKRILKELFYVSSIVRKYKVDLVYSYFGHALFRGKIPQVSGVAISNVFFPEIDFWQGSRLSVFVNKLIDKYRIYGVKKADALIFENKSMEKRSHLLYGIQSEKTTFIPPSLNLSFESTDLNLPKLQKDATKLLMLCGWQLNKNIMNVPIIASHLKKKNKKFQFVITAPLDNSKYHKAFIELTERYQVQDMIYITGSISKSQLKSLYEQIDFVLLMSKLESFSNNIIEAWYFNKPLIVSNEAWSRSICNDAAYYIDRSSTTKTAESIITFNMNENLQQEVINQGLLELKTYPTITEKTDMELTFLNKIYNEYKIKS